MPFPFIIKGRRYICLVIDFSKIDMRKRPNFILRNLDNTKIGVLGHILNPSGVINYNEISEISFEYPAYDNGEKLDEYDLLTSMRIIDVEGYGQFILQKPIENDDMVSKIKSCKGYSLEHELSGKEVTVEEGTYNFWNPMAKESSIMGIILSEIPSWKIGYVSSDLIGKYRTYSANKRKIYDFMKTDLQKTYGCIFDFDTYNRVINVRSVESIVTTKAIYLSSKNLLNKIEIEENTDELVTVLDVHGADDLDIRSVNPMGTNKIYNLDAYMNESYFSKEMITQWKKWKQTFDAYQQTYFDMSVEQTMLISQLVTENAVLTDLEGELSGLESKKATLIQGVTMDSSLQDDLNAVKSEISAKEKEINNQKNLVIVPIENKITLITEQLKNINQLTAFSAFFSEEQIEVLDCYFKYGSLTDSTFVATNTDSYSTDGTTARSLSSIFNLVSLTDLQKTEYTSDKTFYSIRGGMIETSHSDFSLDAEIVRGTLEVNSDLTFVLSLYLNDGMLNNDVTFSGATLSMTGTLSANVISSASVLQFKTSVANVYFTRDVTEYQKQSIAMELYDYAVERLDKLSSPTFYFTVDSANFLALDDFVDFAKQFELGEKVYLHIDDTVLEPIAMSVSIDFDDLSDFEIQFSDNYRLNSKEFTLESILDQAISGSNSLDLNQYNYSNFVSSGAKTSVEQFMKSAIDAMKNNIMAGENNELKIDGTGLRCMKYDETSGTYSPKQIWMAHNAIMFTEDNWESATIGIGEFTDKNFGTLYGIVLPALVGTLLAGKNLIIESEKQDGGVAVFKMDAEGASLHNASFNLYGETGGRIDMGAIFGLVGGGDPTKMFVYDQFNNPVGVKTANNKSVTKVEDLDANDTPNANFWLDMDGGLYIKGVIDAVGGIFRGSLEVGGSTAFRVDAQGNLKIGGTATNPNFSVDANGNLVANTGTFKGTVYGATYKDNNGNVMMNSNQQFKADYLSLNGINVGNGQFVVDANGNVSVSGSIKMGTGSSIDWSQITEQNASMSLAYIQATDAFNYAGTAYDKAGNAYNLATDAYDYADNAYDLARENRITDKKVFDVLTGGGTRFGIFSDSSTNRLYINANYIRSGTIDADIVTLGSGWGGFACARGSTGISVTYGAKMYGSDEDYYFIATDAGVRMQAPDNGITITNNVISASEEITVSSDRRIKNSISYDMEKYSGFFMSLKPSFYRFNKGSSQRFHIGFIAQDVEAALLDNGLATSDFAGFVRCAGAHDVHDQYLDQCYLRYSDFISLNTFMIQKLYREIEQLKEKLNQCMKENDND
jgi:hypothetical protein